jgi:subtilisin family serine protease
MSRRLVKIIVLTLVLLLTFPLIMGVGSEKERKIVVFREGVSKERCSEIVKKHGGDKICELGLINGQSVMLPAGKADALALQPEVMRVESDAIVTTLAKSVKPAPSPAQILPWGIDAVNAEQCWATNTGDNVKVAVVDTGISTVHPDLVANLKGGASFVSYTAKYNDDNGHGSHVAGIIGALNNSIGVVGVGPKIDLYAVKVLDRNGKGYISDIIKGLEWCINNKMQVVNMSLGSSTYSQSLADAVKKVNAAGIVQVAAAGNSGADVIYPAALEEAIICK